MQCPVLPFVFVITTAARRPRALSHFAESRSGTSASYRSDTIRHRPAIGPTPSDIATPVNRTAQLGLRCCSRRAGTVTATACAAVSAAQSEPTSVAVPAAVRTF